MRAADIARVLDGKGIRRSAHRIAVAEKVLACDEHPSADEVWAMVKKSFPAISRATVYNSLNLFVKKGLLRELILAEGRIVFDPLIAPHHHFIDESTGRIYDVPWDAIDVAKVDKLRGFDVTEYQVVLRGRRRR